MEILAAGRDIRPATPSHSPCVILFAGDVAPPSFEGRRITAQHVSFGEQPNDAPIEEGIHYNQRFGLGAVEGKYRFLHRHFRQQHFIRKVQELLDGALRCDVGAMRLRDQDETDVTVEIVDRDT